MNAFATLLPVIFPIIAGIGLLPVKFKDRKDREKWVLSIVVLNALFALYAIWGVGGAYVTLKTLSPAQRRMS